MPSDQLQRSQIPDEDASYTDMDKFALDLFSPKAAGLTDEDRDRMDREVNTAYFEGRPLEFPLTTLRMALHSEMAFKHIVSPPPDEKLLKYPRALLARIREVVEEREAEGRDPEE